MGTVPPVPTFTTGEDLTSADMNKIRDALNFSIYNRPLCKAHATVAQSIPNGTITPMTFDVTDVDTDAGRTGVGSGTDRYVCRTQGWYSISATVGYAQSTAGSRFAIIAINGAYQNGYSSVPAPAANAGVNVSGLVHMAVDDYLQICSYQDSGAALNTAVTPTYQACSLSLQFELAG